MFFHRLPLLFLAAGSILLSTYTQPVHAASPEPTGFRNVNVWVNPEYDDPRLLFMMEGKIVGANAPALVRFLVPSSAFMYSAGSKDAQGKYTGGPPARAPSSIPGWDEISYTVTSDTFRVEYYDDSAIASQPDKKIAYDFRWLYPISDLTISIQKPRTATDFVVTPQGLAGIDGDGLAVQRFTYQNLGTDNSTLHYDITYTKTDAAVSVTNPQLNSSGSSGSPNVPLFLWVLVGIVILGGALWILKSLKTSNRLATSPASRKTATVPSGKRPTQRFCRNCGKPTQSSDKFCPHCGNKAS